MSLSHLKERYSDLLAAKARAASPRQRDLIQAMIDETAEEITRLEDRYADRSPISHAALTDAIEAAGYSHESACAEAADLLYELEYGRREEAARIIALLI